MGYLQGLFVLRPTLKDNEVYHSDEFIIYGIKNSNEIVLNALYKMHYTMVVNLIINNSGTEQEAKDIYQEAIIAFYEKVQDQGFTLSCQIKTYLYAICKRLWLKRLYQKTKYVGKIEEHDVFPEIESEVALVEENEKKFSAMNNSMSQLREPCKTILEDFYLNNLSMEDITEKFGYTNTDNAKNQKYKCLQRVKKIFFSQYK